MTAYVVDTHGLIWFLENNPRLGHNCKAVLSDPHNNLILPATALAEALWIVERGRTTITSPAALLAALDADARISLYSLDRTVIIKSLALTPIAEMHDRQIVATALVLAEQGQTVALLTKDGNIHDSNLVTCIW